MRLAPVFVLLIGLVSACERTIVVNPTNPSTNPTTPTEVAKPIKVDYRVSGNAITARIRYSNPIDGLTQVITALPFSVSFSTTTDQIFLSIESTPLTYPSTVIYPFMSVQIFVNGVLFREASSADFVQNPISVNGTWRR
jgi:hypothetical protein